ncbi:MAG: nonstructural protein [Microvirus sp.]|nr:MAG: nonstructural protein [Microvirus sp.]
MKMRIFAVRDSATQSFGTPMFLMSNGQAVRSFTDEVNRKAEENQLYNHPEDFELYVFGQFDSSDGSFDCAVPECVCRGKDISLKFVEAN